MQNKAANSLTLLGIGLHIMYWFGILYVFLRVKSRWFDSYTVWNPDVVSGSTQSDTFVDMRRAMIYSGTLFNWFCFFLLIMLIVILVQSLVFIALEITAYIKIRKNPFSAWGSFILAMGIKNIFTNTSGIPFLIAGFLLHKQQKEPQEPETKAVRRKNRRRASAFSKRKAAAVKKRRNLGIKS